MTLECSVPHCEQDAITRLGYCHNHGRMPFHVGLTLHIRVRPRVSRQSTSKVVAEVDMRRELIRFRGEQGWVDPKTLTLQAAPTPKEWLDLEETPAWKAGDRGLTLAKAG